MANKKSALKKSRQDLILRRKRKKTKNELVRLVKKADAKGLVALQKKLDKAAKIHLIHPNKAARIKSQLAKKYQKKTANDRAKKN